MRYPPCPLGLAHVQRSPAILVPKSSRTNICRSRARLLFCIACWLVGPPAGAHTSWTCRWCALKRTYTQRSCHPVRAAEQRQRRRAWSVRCASGVVAAVSAERACPRPCGIRSMRRVDQLAGHLKRTTSSTPAQQQQQQQRLLLPVAGKESGESLTRCAPGLVCARSLGGAGAPYQ